MDKLTLKAEKSLGVSNSESRCQFRAYSIKHNCDVDEFLESYRGMLQRAVDEIWDKIMD